MKNIPKTIMTSKLSCFLCGLSSKQKYSFNECPLTKVTPLTMILPYGEHML